MSTSAMAKQPSSSSHLSKGEGEKETSGEKLLFPVQTKSTKAAFLHQKKKDYKSRICLKITLCCCIGSSAAGFCLLIAGGIGGHSEVKTFMYIGILTFLVSLVLLIIICSSSATGTSRLPIPNPLPPSNCLYEHTLTENGKIKFISKNENESQGISLYAIPHAKNSLYPLEYCFQIPEKFSKNCEKISDETKLDPSSKNIKYEGFYPQIWETPKMKEKQACNIKNCVCQLKDSSRVLEVECENLNYPFPYVGASFHKATQEDSYEDKSTLLNPHPLERQRQCHLHQLSLNAGQDNWQPNS